MKSLKDFYQLLQQKSTPAVKVGNLSLAAGVASFES